MKSWTSQHIDEAKQLRRRIDDYIESVGVRADLEAHDVGAVDVAEWRTAAQVRALRVMLAGPQLLEACKAISAECLDANPNGDICIPSHVWDLVSQAIAEASIS